jgi:hypothetical protein
VHHLLALEKLTMEWKELVLYDKEILVQEPVLHRPRCFASTSTQHPANLKTHTNSELDTEKRKFTATELYTHSAEKTNTKNDDEDMMFWTGPLKNHVHLSCVINLSLLQNPYFALQGDQWLEEAKQR